MNCSLLDDEDYVNDITEKIPIWLAEGRKDLSDSRSIWDWLKYNIRAHTIHSKILDPLGRYVILKAEINDKMYVLINVCAPNKDTYYTAKK